MAAIQYLHSKGVCHRDLHPGNVLINTAFMAAETVEVGSKAQNPVKLIDFNVAAKFKAPSSDEIKGGTGYQHWSAPETRTGMFYSSKCDWFTCGLLIAYMLESVLLNRQQAADSEEDDYKESGPDLKTLKNLLVSKTCASGICWWRLIDGLLSMEPSERWSPEQAADYLKTFREELLA